jgi:hypothetical protein
MREERFQFDSTKHAKMSCLSFTEPRGNYSSKFTTDSQSYSVYMKLVNRKNIQRLKTKFQKQKCGIASRYLQNGFVIVEFPNFS